ncbi:hypothetical protein [Falsiroseomonas sp. HW251]|uniref:hypothetical protein n=1 Tax=Falsiroseomonas sp. HW251 TaxID=3390998 RepID=UPI003D31F097
MDALTPATHAVRDAIRVELDPRLAELRAFVDRRIAELSAEIHAGVQLADMGEERITGEIARMQDQIARPVAVSGRELAPGGALPLPGPPRQGPMGPWTAISFQRRRGRGHFGPLPLRR